MAHKEKFLLLTPYNEDYRGQRNKFLSLIRAESVSFLSHLGAAIIATELEKEGLEVKVEDLHNPKALESASGFDFVGISAMTPDSDRAISVAKELGRRNIPVVGGGSYFSMNIEEAIKRAPNLLIVKGEAGGLFKDMLEGLRKRESGKVYSRDKPLDLQSEYAAAQRRFLPNGRESQGESFLSAMELGRGCNNSCDFCGANFIPAVRHRSIESIAEELGAIPPNKRIGLVDNNISAYPADFLKEVFTLFSKQKRRWFAEGVLNETLMDKEVLSLMRDGCFLFLTGIEDLSHPVSGCGDKISGDIEKLRHYSELVNRYSIPTLYSLMFGTDNQSFDYIINAIELVNELKLTTIIHKAIPFIGTRWYKEIEKDGRMEERYLDPYGKTHILFKPKHMEKTELLKGISLFHKEVFSPYRCLERSAYHSENGNYIRNLVFDILANLTGAVTSYYLNRRK